MHGNIFLLRIYSDMFRLLKAIFRLNIQERVCVYYSAVKWTKSYLH
jgi:hypothetical protein